VRGKKRFARGASSELAAHVGDEPLTPGEVEVLRLIAAGNANKQIATQLSISKEIVKSRVKDILFKLGSDDEVMLKRGIIQS